MKVSVRLISRQEYESGTIDSGVLYLVQDSHGILPYMGTEKVSIDSLSPQLQEEVGSILDPKVAAGESSVVSAQAAQIAAEASAAVAASDLAATTGNIAVVEEKIDRLKSLHVGTVESSPDRTEVSLSEDMALNFVLQKGDKGDQGVQGEKGDAFTYDDFTAEQLEGLRGPQGIQGEKGDQGIQGEKGDAFTYGDFTEEQLEGLRGPQGVQGEKGNAFTYADFTEEQLESLRGPQGAKGEKGDKGDAFEYSDFTPGQLEALRGPQGIQGEKGDPGEPQWGAIAGDISSQQDLQQALDGKAGKSTTLAGYGIADAYTKGEVDAKVSSVYRYKGSVTTYAELPTEGNTVGDVWNIASADEEHGIKAGDNVAWTGDQWDALSGTVDLTPYATKDELSAGLEGKSDIDHLHTGKYLPLTERGLIPGGYVVESTLSIGADLNCNGRVNTSAYQRNGVNLDDIYAAKSHTHAMGDITGLPDASRYLPEVAGTDGQVLKLVGGAPAWSNQTEAKWGEITGDIRNQEDLAYQFTETIKAIAENTASIATHAADTAIHTTQGEKDAWDAKAEAVHTHAASDVTGLSDELSSLQAGISSVKETANTVSAAVNNHVADSSIHVTSEEKAAWDAKAAGDHNHDDKYLSLENGGTVLNDVQFGKTQSNAWIKLTRNGGIAGGYSCKANGVNCFAIGYMVVCHAHRTWAFGQRITIPYGPESCLVVGYGHTLKETNKYQSFFGEVADTDNDAPLVVGNGTEGSPRNAFEARANGDAYVQGNVLEGGTLLSDKYAAKSHTHAMGDITGLPASGGTAGQVLTKTETGAVWATPPSTGGGSGASWGQITGALQNQADLAAALALKQDSELAIESVSGTALAVLPGKAYNWTLSGNGTLSLGDGWTAGSLSDSVVLLSPGSYSVSCSGNVTMVDSLQAGKMNLCVVRWLGDRARLYVVDSEQLGTITAQPVTASGTVGTAMSVNLSDYVTVSTGANASYAMASGSSLPSGLSLSSEGVLSGTPEAESSDSLTVDVTAAGCTPATLALTMGITAASTAKDLGTWEVEYSMGGIVNSNISGTYTATAETVTTSYGTFPVYSNGKYKLFPLETYNSQALTSVQWAIETEVVADSMLSTLYCAANLVWSSQSPSADYVHVRFNNSGSSGTGPYVSVSTSGYSANTSSAPSYMYDGKYYLHSGSATGTDAVWKLDSPVAECYICQSGQYSAWSVLRDPATPSTVVNELVNNYYAGVSYTSTDGINVALANSVTYNGCTSQYHAS